MGCYWKLRFVPRSNPVTMLFHYKQAGKKSVCGTLFLPIACPFARNPTLQKSITADSLVDKRDAIWNKIYRSVRPFVAFLFVKLGIESIGGQSSSIRVCKNHHTLPLSQPPSDVRVHTRAFLGWLRCWDSTVPSQSKLPRSRRVCNR